LIANGVTTIADMYTFCEEIADEVSKSGISANISRGLTLFLPEFSPESQGFVETEQLRKNWHGHNDGQILVDVSVHGEYTSNPSLWRAVADYAKENALRLHIHISETEEEHEGALDRYGKTPFEILDSYGLWSQGGIAAHCVWTDEEDWALMAKRGVTAVHNPVSNLKLGSGIAKITAMKKAGVNIAIGTDGVASNNNHDMFEELRTAALLQSGSLRDPQALSALDVLKMATVNGAKALGRNTGIIAVGAVADLILVDFDRPHLMPCHSVVENLVYSARGSDVAMNMARGNIIYQEGEYFTLDMERIRHEVSSHALPLLFG